ncbi:hypothetical protein CEP88_02410 [Roseobacter denitrificans]|uniref:hypothetical protein n=1 Tax=Roseobacter denitrificans TaxID=2434 RepID=UPI0003082336|nr:hypothetical protein [Roseobacter denitrificans]AVL51579.1 hypothetical protein CEP88_02410 [Roseobacter denitrificans]SFF76734.1 hypothetical protein SAMN05443635_1028 [Roseobacter denitrificans OCh 114]
MHHHRTIDQELIQQPKRRRNQAQARFRRHDARPKQGIDTNSAFAAKCRMVDVVAINFRLLEMPERVVQGI